MKQVGPKNQRGELWLIDRARIGDELDSVDPALITNRPRFLRSSASG